MNDTTTFAHMTTFFASLYASSIADLCNHCFGLTDSDRNNSGCSCNPTRQYSVSPTVAYPHQSAATLLQRVEAVALCTIATVADLPLPLVGLAHADSPLPFRGGISVCR